MRVRELSGIYLPSTTAGETFRAFVPRDLPPEPRVELSDDLYDVYEKANRALGRLDGISLLLPDTGLFIYMYLRKEAVLSSQIEGTQSSLSDLLLFELDEVPGVPIDDVVEVSNYVAALNHGLQRIRRDGFPLSSRLIKELHSVLMRSGRGSEKQPGEFRTSQNWLGGGRPGNARFVPPPHTYVPDLVSNLEHFLHDTYGRTPSLIKAALAHVQFETIHPFLDGNGRLGRLLITLLLYTEGVLEEPTLYLSLYFKEHRDQYYQLLQKVREESAWEEWLEFFLQGVRETAQQAFTTAQVLVAMFTHNRGRIQDLGRAAGSTLQVHTYLQRQVFLSVSEAEKQLPLSVPTILKSISALEELGMVREVTGKERNRVWVYEEYLRILSNGG
ncbi:MAG: Fic family protein [Trueperaceae bacterium]